MMRPVIASSSLRLCRGQPQSWSMASAIEPRSLDSGLQCVDYVSRVALSDNCSPKLLLFSSLPPPTPISTTTHQPHSTTILCSRACRMKIMTAYPSVHSDLRVFVLITTHTHRPISLKPRQALEEHNVRHSKPSSGELTRLMLSMTNTQGMLPRHH
jgi:hypothetical protein